MDEEDKLRNDDGSWVNPIAMFVDELENDDIYGANQISDADRYRLANRLYNEIINNFNTLDFND